MKKMIIAGLVGALWVMGFSGVTAKAADKAPHTVTVINLGALDETGVKGLEAYLTANVTLPVRMVTVSKVREIDDVFDAIAKVRKPGDAIVVAVAPVKDLDAITLVDADHALALVNTEALSKAAKTPLRVNLAVMRALAASLGVGRSPDPHCVYRIMATPAEYDQLGGNFSPPTLQQVLLNAGEHGVVSTLPTRRHPAPLKK